MSLSTIEYMHRTTSQRSTPSVQIKHPLLTMRDRDILAVQQGFSFSINSPSIVVSKTTQCFSPGINQKMIPSSRASYHPLAWCAIVKTTSVGSTQRDIYFRNIEASAQRMASFLEASLSLTDNESQGRPLSPETGRPKETSISRWSVREPFVKK